jgi:hypothetical protein
MSGVLHSVAKLTRPCGGHNDGVARCTHLERLVQNAVAGMKSFGASGAMQVDVDRERFGQILGSEWMELERLVRSLR